MLVVVAATNFHYLSPPSPVFLPFGTFFSETTGNV